MNHSNVQRLIEAIAGDLLASDENGKEIPASNAYGYYLLLTLLLRYETEVTDTLTDYINKFDL